MEREILINTFTCFEFRIWLHVSGVVWNFGRGSLLGLGMAFGFGLDSVADPFAQVRVNSIQVCTQHHCGQHESE